MKKTKRDIPGDILTLLSLVEAGRLFDVQAWIQKGKRIRPPENDREKFCPLFQAIETGFHSMVAVLLEAKEWEQQDLDRAVGRAMEDQRVDFADLLLERGASPTAVDFCDVCRTMDLDLMERYLRIGCDPAFENAFARALDKFKARPLLRFLRNHQDEFPSLRAQASLALGVAAREERPRWVALLAWAGADPFLKVPDSLYGDWNFEDYSGITPVKLTCWSQDPQIFKVLKLKPTSEQARDLLRWAAYLPRLHAVRELLRMLPKSELNVGDPPTCLAVETAVSKEIWSIYGEGVEPKERETAECLKILLAAGGRWHPPWEKIRDIRRSLLRNSGKHVAQIVRILAENPGAAEAKWLVELCRTPAIGRKIGMADPGLLDVIGRS